MNAMEITGLTVGYNKRSVLKELNLNVEQGKMIAIVGQNGAGKSTFIKSVMGFVRPSYGVIKLFGEDLTSGQVKDKIKKGIYYFMQGGKIFPSLTVMENLLFAGHTIDKNNLELRINAILKLIFSDSEQETIQDGKTTKAQFLKKNATTLSGGERHKLAIAMVLLNYPRMLLLDEPSAGLAPQDAKKMYDILNSYRTERQMTIILVEQNVKLAAENSDEMHLLMGGSILRSVSCTELKSYDGNIDMQKLDKFFF